MSIYPLVIANEYTHNTWQYISLHGIIDALVSFQLQPSIRTAKKSFAEGKADNRNSTTVSFSQFSPETLWKLSNECLT